MNYFLISLNYALMVIIPIIVAVFIHRRTGAHLRLFLIGAATFILSQVLHIPFNFLVQSRAWFPGDVASWPNLLAVGAFLGLSSGVFEEVARYLTYRYWARDARSWSRGLMLGAGHGGIEAIVLGGLAAVNFAALLFATRNETVLGAIPQAERALITGALAGIVNAPWYSLLLGAAERLFAVLAHLAMSLLVLQVFLRRNLGWLVLAILYHAVFNMLAVVASQRIGPYATEGLLAVFSLASLLIIFRLRAPEPVAPEPEPLAEVSVGPIALEPTPDAIERSRYSG